MFREARLKLTGWYLLILSTIVILFSVTIYRLVNLEINRVAKAQRSRIERWQIIVPQTSNLPPMIFFDDTEVNELRRRLLFMLAMVDTTLIIIAGGLSYLLAGKTLSPIEKMVLMQERFVADSSHELRTPLTALRTSMEVALRDKSMNKNIAKQVIEENLKEVVRLQSLAESLLELTRSGKKMKLEKTKIAEVIANANEQVSKIAEEKKIRIQISNTKIVAYANPLALERVVMILLDNAIKYSDSGSTIKITTKLEKKMARIIISDQGRGIESSQLPRIFERFYRGDKARSSSIPGYGLGLSIAKELIEAQDGEIIVESEEGVGTTVDLRIQTSA